MRAHRSFLLLALASLSAACRCGSDVSDAEADFRLSTDSLDFGRVLEGASASLPFEVVSTGRREVTVSLSASGPFGVPEEGTVPGGGALPVQVTFTASEGVHEGELVVEGAGVRRTLRLRGEGVRPLDCQPSGPCRVSTFDLALGACVETVALDGASCVPASLCLENGVCAAGQCLGSPKLCNDGNVCTDDQCAPAQGCVFAQKTCPTPQGLCKVPVCHPTNGCGEADAPDLSVCGAVDCITADLCISGGCQTLPTPEGFVCFPPTPCQGEGTCQLGACKRPDPVTLVPAFTAPLPGHPRLEDGRAVVLESGGQLFLEVCVADGGCGLMSYTANGFERFMAPYPDTAARRLVAATQKSLFVAGAEGFEAYASGTGGRLWTTPLQSLPRPAEAADGGVARAGPLRAAVTAAGDLFLAVGWELPSDGGPSQGPLEVQSLARLSGEDGGLSALFEVRGLGHGGSVALTADETELYLATPSGPFGRVSLGDDGGVGPALRLGDDAGTGELATSGRSLAVGQGALVLRAADGGAATVVGELPRDAGTRPSRLGALLQQRLGYTFDHACPAEDAGCAPFDEALEVRAFALAIDGGWPDAGRELYRLEVLPGGLGASLESAALVSGGGVCALTQTSDGGPNARLHLFDRGERLFTCAFPPGTQLRGATFGAGKLFVLADRDAGTLLEAYDLQGLPLETTGWPVPGGVSGTRRARTVP